MSNLTAADCLVFYRPATPDRPHPECIDMAIRGSDGTYVGHSSGKTQDALAEEYGCEILMLDAASFSAMRNASYTTEPEPIEECDFVTALECLPPMRWGTWLGVESFRICEFYCGNVTSIYARTADGRFWHFRGDAFMSGEDIALKVQAAAAQAHVPG